MQSKTINSYILYISIIGLSFLIGIPQAINQWLHEDIFYKYFNKGETHWCYDLATILLLLSIYFYSDRLDKQLKISPFVISIVVLYFIFLGNYRYLYNGYLTPIYFNPCNNWIKYFDVLFIIPIIPFAYYYVNKGNDLKISEDELLKNRDSIEFDYLNTEERVNYFYTCLKSELKVYGIVGEWGSGKSFFIEKLKSKLDLEQKVYIEFNPWKYKDLDLIIEKFSKIIEHKLVEEELISKKEFENFSNQFIKSITSIKFPFIEFNTSFGFQEGVQGSFKLINEKLNNSETDIYIIIDDLDRLKSEEIFNVLMFLRNVFSFDKFKYIIAFDKDYIIQSLDNLQIPKSKNYLEKIVEFEYILIGLTSQERAQILYDKLKNYDAKKIILNLDPIVFKPFNTIRSINYFAEDFIPNFKKLKNEVDFKYFLYITILKRHYKETYIDIYVNRLDYFEKDFRLKSNNTAEISNTIEDSKLHVILNSSDDKLINHLFKELFICSNDIYKINTNHNFYKYFSGIIQNKLIRNEQIIKLLDKELSLNDFVDEQLPELINLLRIHKNYSDKQIVNLGESIIELLSKELIINYRTEEDFVNIIFYSLGANESFIESFKNIILNDLIKDDNVIFSLIPKLFSRNRIYFTNDQYYKIINNLLSIGNYNSINSLSNFINKMNIKIDYKIKEEFLNIIKKNEEDFFLNITCYEDDNMEYLNVNLGYNDLLKVLFEDDINKLILEISGWNSNKADEFVFFLKKIVKEGSSIKYKFDYNSKLNNR